MVSAKKIQDPKFWDSRQTCLHRNRYVSKITVIYSSDIVLSSDSTSTRMAGVATLIKSNACFGGLVNKYRHDSAILGCSMTFSVFLPPSCISESASNRTVPYVVYLSGLTCTDDNVMHKSGVQQHAAAKNIAVVCPDTSPRGLGIPGEDDSYDFGSGAGFYVNATESPWEKYRMDDYVVKERPQVLQASKIPLDSSRVSICGHSMGGHGALVLALRNPGTYSSVSAFAPICHPSVVPWGIKAFSGYLGKNKESWKAYDATELAANYSGSAIDILIDTGLNDEFLEEQLRPEDFLEAATKNDALHVRMNSRESYDHSYYFIATFMKDHIDFHASHLL